MSLQDKFGLIHSYINVKEYGQYIVQECPILQKYVVWDKEDRIHLNQKEHSGLLEKSFFSVDAYSFDNDGIIIFHKKEDAEDFAVFLKYEKEIEFAKMHPEFEER